MALRWGYRTEGSYAYELHAIEDGPDRLGHFYTVCHGDIGRLTTVPEGEKVPLRGCGRCVKDTGGTPPSTEGKGVKPSRKKATVTPERMFDVPTHPKRYVGDSS